MKSHSDPRSPQDDSVESMIASLESAGRRATALGEAARWGRVDLVEKLLRTGLDVDARNEFDATSLMLAASGGQTKVVTYLLERGADVNAIGGPDSMTPLMTAIAAFHPKSVYIKACKLLLDAGAVRTISHRDQDGKTALDWARDGRPAELIALIEQHSPAPSAGANP